MTLCPACGFQLWPYNHETLTCKHGHRWTEAGEPTVQTAKQLAPAPPVEQFVEPTPEPEPQPTPEYILEPADPSLRPFAGFLAAFVGGGLVSLLADLILR